MIVENYSLAKFLTVLKWYLHCSQAKYLYSYRIFYSFMTLLLAAHA